MRHRELKPEESAILIEVRIGSVYHWESGKCVLGEQHQVIFRAVHAQDTDSDLY
jgi:hypothetical protein